MPHVAFFMLDGVRRLAAGPGIRPGYRIPVPVSLMDTAPTIARLLEVAPHGKWEGRCVEEIFEAGVGASAPSVA